MKFQFLEVWRLLTKKERVQLSKVSGLHTFSGLTDMLGVVSILPFLSVAAKPDILQSNEYLIGMKNWLQFSNNDFLIFLGILSLIALFLNQLVRLFSSWYGQFISLNIWRNLHNRMFSYYLNQSYMYHLRHPGNELLEKLQIQTNAAVVGVIQPYFLLISSFFTTLFTLSLIIFIEPVMTSILLVIMGLFYFLIFKFLKSRLDYYGKVGPEFSQKTFKLIEESFGAIKEIKVRRNGQIYLDLFDPLAKRYCDANVKLKLFGSIPKALVELVAFGSILLITILMIKKSDGFMDVVPVLGMYALALSRLIPAIHSIFNQFSRIRFYSPSLHSIQEVLIDASKSNEVRPLNALKAKDVTLAHNIELENLSFAYSESTKKVLDAISLNIPVGHLIGIAGGSGAGKTTLIDLILGLFKPVLGSIKIDGNPLTESNISSWQTRIGYVPQSGFIANGSIARNIAFGIHENEIDMQRVIDMAKITQISEFIETELPEKYETLVGDRGVLLSGGQCQRITIARALYHDPDVLILDEATSALDGITENKVINAILKFSKQKTIIMIAHRLSTLKDCDNIFFIEKGKLVDQGNYHSLMANNKIFKQMAKTNSK